MLKVSVDEIVYMKFYKITNRTVNTIYATEKKTTLYKYFIKKPEQNKHCDRN